MLSSKSVKEHYQSIREEYDSYPLVSGMHSHAHRLETIQELLELEPDTDHVVDLGAGTAQMGRLWKTKYPQARPFLCVDPSPMLPMDDPLIEPLKSSALNFSQREDITYDALIIVQAVNNMTTNCNLDEVLARFKAQLRDDRGRICIAIRPSDSSNIPLFEAAHASFSSDSLTADAIQDSLKKAGFSHVKIVERALNHDISKGEWYNAIRGRFFSNLQLHTDEEIDQGIQELEQGRLKDCDQVTFEDIFHYICAWK